MTIYLIYLNNVNVHHALLWIPAINYYYYYYYYYYTYLSN
jgi:hypothetical protein